MGVHLTAVAAWKVQVQSCIPNAWWILVCPFPLLPKSCFIQSLGHEVMKSILVSKGKISLVTLIWKRDSRQPFCLASAFKLGKLWGFSLCAKSWCHRFLAFSQLLDVPIRLHLQRTRRIRPSDRRQKKPQGRHDKITQLATRKSLWGQASQSLQEVGNRLESIRFEVGQLDSTPIFASKIPCFVWNLLGQALVLKSSQNGFPTFSREKDQTERTGRKKAICIAHLLSVTARLPGPPNAPSIPKLRTCNPTSRCLVLTTLFMVRPGPQIRCD